MQSLFLVLFLLNLGGKPRPLIEALVEIIHQGLAGEFYLSEGAREYIKREVEYLLDYLAREDKVTGKFLFDRLRNLRKNLLKLKLACPRREITFSALLREDDKDETPEWIFLDPPPAVPSELREKADSREKTRLRSLTLMRLEKWSIGCLKEAGQTGLIQQNLFEAT